MTLIRCNLNLHFMFKYGRLVVFFSMKHLLIENCRFHFLNIDMQSMTKSVTVYYFFSLSLKRIRASVLNFKKKVNWVFTARKLEHDIAKITSGNELKRTTI